MLTRRRAIEISIEIWTELADVGCNKDESKVLESYSDKGIRFFALCPLCDKYHPLTNGSTGKYCNAQCPLQGDTSLWEVGECANHAWQRWVTAEEDDNLMDMKKEASIILTWLKRAHAESYTNSQYKGEL